MSDILKLVKPKSFYALCKDKNYSRFYKTGCKELDEYLEGGLPIGKVIHLYGPAGVGKSQFCTLLAANMWNQEKIRRCYFLHFGNLSFLTPRYLEFCESLGIEKDQEELFSIVSVCRLVFIEKLLENLKHLIETEEDVGLVCVEGLPDFTETYPQEQHFSITHALANTLLKLSEKKKCVVIYVNQARESFHYNPVSKLHPALGVNFYMQTVFRMFMDFESNERSVRKIILERWRFAEKDPFLFKLAINGFAAVK